MSWELVSGFVLTWLPNLAILTLMNQFLTSIPALAWLMPIIMLWGQIKSFALNSIRLVIVETQVSGIASIALLQYLRLHGKRLPSNVLKYASTWAYSQSRKGSGILLFEGSRDLPTQWYWHKGNVFTVTEKRGQDKERGVMVENLTVLLYLRGTINIEELLKEAVSWYENREKITVEAIKSPRFYVRRFIGKNDPVFAGEKAGNSIAPAPAMAEEDWKFARLLNYSLADLGYASKLFFYVFNENARKVYDDVARWLKSKEWYEDKGLLHRRGSLLFGPAGSGKSSLIRKVGQSLDLPVFSFELSTMTDPQLINFWDSARCSSPCIVVMEDIDTVFNKREPATANIKLSFECLLNCISGVEPAEGVYLFVTTNRLDHLDDALGIPNAKGVSTRPGRLDTCFEMGEITLAEKAQIAAHFLKDYPMEAETIIEKSNGCTAAQFSDMCSQKALEMHWEGNK